MISLPISLIWGWVKQVLTVQAQTQFIPGPFADFGNAYAVDYPANTQLNLTFPTSVLPAEQGTIEFWGKLSNFPDAISNSGVAFLAPGPHVNFPQTGFRLGFATNDGCGGGGLYGTIGVGIDSICSGLADRATGDFGDSTSYSNILGDATAWHHYALVWNQDGLPDGHRVTIFLDGVEVPLTYSQDFAPQIFDNPANYPGQVFSLAMNNGQGAGTIAIDNLVIHNTAMLDFSGRFTETPVGDDVVLWNRLGSVTEIEASIIGPGGTLVTPVPEPSTYAMLLAGLGLIGFMSHRKKNRHAIQPA